MMVAKATTQDKGFASRWPSRLTYLSFVMLSPLLDSYRARLATGPFEPQPEHPDRALRCEEAPARARDLPASPNLVNLRNDNNTSKSQRHGKPSRAEGHYFGPPRIHRVGYIKTGLVARLRRH